VGTATNTRHTAPAATLISRVEDGRHNHYEIWADLETCDTPHDTARLRFQSRWTGAGDPDARHNQGEFYLDATGLDNLRRLLGAR